VLFCPAYRNSPVVQFASTHTHTNTHTHTHTHVIASHDLLGSAMKQVVIMTRPLVPSVSHLGWALLAIRVACWCYSVVRIVPTFSHNTCHIFHTIPAIFFTQHLPYFSHDTCHIQPILLSYLAPDTRVPYCLVYRSFSQPDVAGMM
jgi:hypothetical protein